MNRSLKALVESNLLPKKATISKTFEVDRRRVKVEAAYSPIDGVTAFNVRVLDPTTKSMSFGMLTSTKFDPVDCAVFGTRVVSCGIREPFPQCKNCELSPENLKSERSE